jgi:hypothetical protein
MTTILATQQIIDKFISFNYFQNPNDGIGVALALLFFIEMIFIYLIVSYKKEADESWLIHTLNMKFAAIVLLLICSGLIWLLILAILFLALGIEEIFNLINKDALYIIALVIIWICANYLIAKNFGEEEPKPKKKRRKTKSRRIKR